MSSTHACNEKLFYDETTMYVITVDALFMTFLTLIKSYGVLLLKSVVEIKTCVKNHKIIR